MSKEERKGRFEEKMEVAMRMLEHGMSVDEIVTFTELTREEVEKLRESN